MKRISSSSFAVLRYADLNNGTVSMFSHVRRGATLVTASNLARSGHLTHHHGYFKITEKGRDALKVARAHPWPCRPMRCGQCDTTGVQDDRECLICCGSGQVCSEHYNDQDYAAALLKGQTVCESQDAAAAKGGSKP